MILGYKYRARLPEQSLLTCNVLSIIGICVVSQVYLHASVLALAHILHL